MKNKRWFENFVNKLENYIKKKPFTFIFDTINIIQNKFNPYYCFFDDRFIKWVKNDTQYLNFSVIIV